MKEFMKKYVGDKAFYLYVIGIVLPMIIQNLVTNFVSMLDNIMVGQVGTAQMSGVSIVNQFMFVFNITVFGGLAGAGIFGTQFFGKGDPKGQMYTFRFRLWMVVFLMIVGAFVFSTFDEELIYLFLSGDDTPELIQDTLNYGKCYLRIMLWGLIPFGLGQAYSSVVRECGETKIPMISSIAAIGVNLLLDYGLIFGKLGMPCMGVAGAAIATVVAKTIEALVVIVWAHTHIEKNKYLKGLFTGLTIPMDLTRKILVKSLPLLANEFLWSLGMSIIAQSYSVRGLEVVAARNIASTLTNMFSVVFIQLGASIGIIVGAKLGAGLLEEAKDYARKLTFFSITATICTSIMCLPLAYGFPAMYNTEDSVKSLATFIIMISAIAMPLWAYTHCCYFILRSGGKTGMTFLFDFTFSWFVMIPLAFLLSRFSSLDFKTIFIIVTFSETIKIVIGYFMVKSEVWVQNIVG